MADVHLCHWTAADYHASDRISRSLVAAYDTDPALYHAQRVALTSPLPEASDAMHLGTCFHCAVLEPEEWERRMQCKPARKGEGIVKQIKEWEANLPPDALIVTDAEVTRVHRMRDALFKPRTPIARTARRMLDACEREVTYTWRDEDPQLAAPMECRARLDLLHVSTTEAHILDLKSIGSSPDPRSIGRAVGEHKYHWQAPFYSAPVLEATGLVPTFGFIFVRSVEPFDVAIYRLRPEDITAAEVQVRRAMRRLSTCIATNTWTASYEAGAQVADIPRWYLETT